MGRYMIIVCMHCLGARGDYTENSDVDVMILVKTTEEDIRKFSDQVSDCAFAYMMQSVISIKNMLQQIFLRET